MRYLAIGVDVMDLSGPVFQGRAIGVGGFCLDQRDEMIVVGYDVVQFRRDVPVAHVRLHDFHQRLLADYGLGCSDRPPFDVVGNDASECLGVSRVELGQTPLCRSLREGVRPMCLRGRLIRGYAAPNRYVEPMLAAAATDGVGPRAQAALLDGSTLATGVVAARVAAGGWGLLLCGCLPE